MKRPLPWQDAFLYHKVHNALLFQVNLNPLQLVIDPCKNELQIMDIYKNTLIN